jgi:inward rectifier potassium channel
MAIKKNSLVDKEKERQDLGFGTNVTSRQARIIKANGEFNVKKLGQSFSARVNVYNKLILMSWPKFFAYIMAFYLSINFIFASVYYFVGTENLKGITSENSLTAFGEAFFFSSQTLTTVGYGHVSPSGFLTSSIAAFEAMIGLLIFSIMTGLLYGRFSRPNPKVVFSENAIVAPYLNINGLMFRMVNEKNNQLINVEVSVIFSRNELDNGEIKRKYYNLELERKQVKFFAMAWTVVHPITESSILFNETAESLAEADAEILISLEGTDDTQADKVHTRRSYLYEEILWGRKFDNILSPVDNTYVIDLNKVGKTIKAELNS